MARCDFYLHPTVGHTDTQPGQTDSQDTHLESPPEDPCRTTCWSVHVSEAGLPARRLAASHLCDPSKHHNTFTTGCQNSSVICHICHLPHPSHVTCHICHLSHLSPVTSVTCVSACIIFSINCYQSRLTAMC